MAMSSLEDLYLDELKDLYNAENQVLKALPKMSKAAQSEDLRRAFEDHLEETRQQVARLEQVFQMHDLKPRGKKCMGMQGILEEGKELLKEDIDPEVMDAVLIAAAQKVEHYEMGAYGTLRTWARELGLHDEAELLQQTLDEEGAADKKLTSLAEAHINQEAEQAGAEMSRMHQTYEHHMR